MAELNNLKRLDGQPWSSWKKLRENFTTGVTNTKNEHTLCMKLSKSDMPIYGLCPKTEVFELVVCNYCGMKFKLAAFAEHISLRHSGEKKHGAFNVDKPVIPKKGKLKRPKEKFKIKTESVTVKVDKNMSIDFINIVSDRKSLTIDSETVSKIKQLHLNAKSSIKSSENDLPSRDEIVSKSGSCNVNESNLNNDVISQKLSDSNVKTHDVSPLPQDGELINMQPIVKLSPIITTSHLSNFSSREKINQIETGPEIMKRSRSSLYNADIHCGVVNNESENCLQSLDCKIHSASLKKLVHGRSKVYEVLFNSGVEKEITNEVSRIKSLEETSSETSLPNAPSLLDNTTNALKYEKKIDKVLITVSNKECPEANLKQCDSVSEDNMIQFRSLKRNLNDRQGLSLPVSIKNPTILCQLQNIKSKFCVPVKTARCSSIQDVLKHNLGHKHVKVQLNSQASKENSESVLINLEGTEETPPVKTPELKPEWFQQWHPGYRRVGGLLYANHNATYVKRQKFVTTLSSFSHEEHCNSFLQPKLNIIRDRSEVIDLRDSDSTKTEFKQMKVEVNTGNNKKSINSVISKQKNHFIMSANVSKSPLPQKVPFSQSTNKAFICKRTSNNINGTLPAKVKRQDGMINTISPVFGKINKTFL